jgi:hypothetical protein
MLIYGFELLVVLLWLSQIIDVMPKTNKATKNVALSGRLSKADVFIFIVTP